MVAAVFAIALQLLLVKDPLRAIFGRSLNAAYIDYDGQLLRQCYLLSNASNEMKLS